MKSFLFEFLQRWCEHSIPPPDGVTSSSPVNECGFFPSFFPDSVDNPSPVLQCQPQSIRLPSPSQQTSTSAKVVNSKAKAMASKRREILRLKGKGNDDELTTDATVIDLDATSNLDASQPLPPPSPLLHEQVLLQGEWLNDAIINKGQNLIRQEFPHIQGLQDISLGHTMAFFVEPREFM